ncbi:hypothetical protein KUCAC02_012479 [Chaenocephalus aceratus]|uniref:Uncharacterized protein n=1 Tax=Chaenocephalus aceratus TaxID=36190 RepID=A0ACB9XAN7_CHAAC|nr:hypothetical protein KUCAC02_012479 [Chaenocephalus aceratus]
MASSNGPEASIYEDDSSSSDHPLADTAGSVGLPESLECSESQSGMYISSSGTYTSNTEPESANSAHLAKRSPKAPRGLRRKQGRPGRWRHLQCQKSQDTEHLTWLSWRR